MDNKKSYIKEIEKTEIWYGEDKAMNGLVRTMARVKSNADIVGDSLAPSFSMGIEKIKNGYINFKTRKVKIRFITEITNDNILYCKELMKYVELRHLEGVKGNLAISETEYVATARLKGEAKPITQTIYSNVRAIIEQHKYFFDNLWNKAIPAKQKIREIEECIPPIQTKIIQDPQEILNKVKDMIESVNKGLDNCSAFGAFQLIYKYEHLFNSYKDLLKKLQQGKSCKGIRWITYIEDKTEQVNLIKKFIQIGVNIRHVSNLPPLYFALSEKEFHGTINKMNKGKMLDSILFSTEPAYIKHFQSFFEELWNNGISAEERIVQIKKGIATETTEIIENPLQIKKIFHSLIENAKEEILVIFPTFNAVKRQHYGLKIKILLNQKNQETVKIRILSPMKNDVASLLFSKALLGKDIDSSSKEYMVLENINIREIS